MKPKHSHDAGKGISNLLFGLVLSAISLGALYSITLRRFGLFIFLIGSLGTIVYLMESISARYKDARATRFTLGVGIISLLFLSLALGFQFTQLPLKPWVLIIGITIAAYGGIQFVRTR